MAAVTPSRHVQNIRVHWFRNQTTGKNVEYKFKQRYYGHMATSNDRIVLWDHEQDVDQDPIVVADGFDAWLLEELPLRPSAPGP